MPLAAERVALDREALNMAMTPLRANPRDACPVTPYT